MNCYECEYGGWTTPYTDKCSGCGAFKNFKRRTAPTSDEAPTPTKSDSIFTKEMPEPPKPLRGSQMILGKAGGKIA
jgi:hypothetical protein